MSNRASYGCAVGGQASCTSKKDISTNVEFFALAHIFAVLATGVRACGIRNWPICGIWHGKMEFRHTHTQIENKRPKNWNANPLILFNCGHRRIIISFSCKWDTNSALYYYIIADYKWSLHFSADIL